MHPREVVISTTAGNVGNRVPNPSEPMRPRLELVIEPVARARIASRTAAKLGLLLVLMVTATWGVTSAERKWLDQRLLRQAQSASHVIEDEYASVERVLRVLASVRASDSPNFDLELAAASRVLGAPVALLFPSADQVAADPNIADLAVSGIVELAAGPAIIISLPAQGASHAPGLLQATLPTTRLVALLTAQATLAGLALDLRDADGRVVVQTRAEAGGNAPPPQDRTANWEGSADGLAGTSTSARVGRTGHVVTVSAPGTTWTGLPRLALFLAAGAGAALAGMFAVLAAIFARRPRWPVRRSKGRAAGAAQDEGGRTPAVLRGLLASNPIGVVQTDPDVPVVRADAVPFALTVASPDAAHEMAAHARAARLREHEASATRDLQALEAAYDRAPVGLCLLDRDLRYLRVNECLAGMNGLPVTAHLGRTIHEVLPHLSDALRPWLERALAGEKVRGAVVSHPFSGRSWSADCVPLRDATGSVAGVSATVQEITAQRAAEAALLRLNEQLKAQIAVEVAAREAAQAGLAHAERLQALGQLASGIAHDVNNVLQAVQASIALIRAQPGDAARVAQLAALVDAASSRGAGITARLLTFARRGELRSGPVDLASLFASLVEVLHPTIGGQIRLEATADPGLAAVFTDRNQLETVLVNLAANARDAIVESGRPGTMRLHAEQDGAGLRIDITDDGAGMSEATLARATEPFFTTKLPGHGTGLGLAMAQGFAEGSGGRLAIRSQVGQGTTVSIWLPVAERAAESVTEPAHTKSEHAKPADIIVVDDDELVRYVLEGELREHGHQVETCDGAAAVLALLDTGAAVDLLLTDLNMPGLNGYALIRAARERRPHLPVVLLTGYADEAIEPLLPGVTLLSKPVRSHVLARAVEELLERAGRGSPGSFPQ